MIKDRNNGPLFIAPRDKNGNKMIWDENKRDYVVNEVLYAIPLKIAPRDSEGNKMVWNTERHVYESKATGQVFSTYLMDFVEQKNKTPEDYMEDEALADELYDEDEALCLMAKEEEERILDELDNMLLMEEEEERRKKEALLQEEAEELQRQEDEDFLREWDFYSNMFDATTDY